MPSATHAARAANLIDAPCRSVDGNSGSNRSLPRRTLPLGSRQNLAEDDLRDVAGLDVGAFKRCLDGDFAKL